MVWFGMVWYGMVWYGMVWYGMVWYGMVWYHRYNLNSLNTNRRAVLRCVYGTANTSTVHGTARMGLKLPSGSNPPIGRRLLPPYVLHGEKLVCKVFHLQSLKQKKKRTTDGRSCSHVGFLYLRKYRYFIQYYNVRPFKILNIKTSPHKM